MGFGCRVDIRGRGWREIVYGAVFIGFFDFWLVIDGRFYIYK